MVTYQLVALNARAKSVNWSVSIFLISVGCLLKVRLLFLSWISRL